jgi:3-dehydroshikimate dehydratase
MTIFPGLCSITFRALAADDVLALAVRAGVAGIEWGADVHVPPGSTRDAQALAARCRDAGVAVVSYGSYLGMAPPDGDEPDGFAAVLDSALALGAPMVRIWTELGVTPDASPDDRRRVIDRTAVIADAIATRGLTAALEFHPFTLTHTAASAVALLADLDRPRLRTHWQPDPALPPADAVAELMQVSSKLAHVHVFSWGPAGIGDRRPLGDGEELWRAALAAADAHGAPLTGPRFALCEYVRDDDPDQFVHDVATLRGWLALLGS